MISWLRNGAATVAGIAISYLQSVYQPDSDMFLHAPVATELEFSPDNLSLQDGETSEVDYQRNDLPTDPTEPAEPVALRLLQQIEAGRSSQKSVVLPPTGTLQPATRFSDLPLDPTDVVEPVTLLKKIAAEEMSLPAHGPREPILPSPLSAQALGALTAVTSPAISLVDQPQTVLADLPPQTSAPRPRPQIEIIRGDSEVISLRVDGILEDIHLKKTVDEKGYTALHVYTRDYPTTPEAPVSHQLPHDNLAGVSFRSEQRTVYRRAWQRDLVARLPFMRAIFPGEKKTYIVEETKPAGNSQLSTTATPPAVFKPDVTKKEITVFDRGWKRDLAAYLPFLEPLLGKKQEVYSNIRASEIKMTFLAALKPLLDHVGKDYNLDSEPARSVTRTPERITKVYYKYRRGWMMRLADRIPVLAPVLGRRVERSVLTDDERRRISQEIADENRSGILSHEFARLLSAARRPQDFSASSDGSRHGLSYFEIEDFAPLGSGPELRIARKQQFREDYDPIAELFELLSGSNSRLAA